VDLYALTAARAGLWLLFLMRASGFMFFAPLLSTRVSPPQLRIALAFFLALIGYIAWGPMLATPQEVTIAWFVPAAVSELMLGLILGYLVGLVFAAFQYAGQLIGYQMGFAVVNVLDPHTQNQVSLIGEFLFAVVMLAFLSMNLHHDMLGLWYESYRIAPPGAFSFAGIAAAHSAYLPALTAACADLFYLALKIAMPLLAFLLLTDLALGIVARVMPQLNVFIVGIPLKVAVGLFFLSMVVLQFDPAVHQSMVRYINHAGAMLHALAT
jgi:flagellar biosynthetic protein FliR